MSAGRGRFAAGAVGKWPGAATAKSLAAAGYLPIAASLDDPSVFALHKSRLMQEDRPVDSQGFCFAYGFADSPRMAVHHSYGPACWREVSFILDNGKATLQTPLWASQ